MLGKDTSENLDLNNCTAIFICMNLISFEKLVCNNYNYHNQTFIIIQKDCSRMRYNYRK